MSASTGKFVAAVSPALAGLRETLVAQRNALVKLRDENAELAEGLNVDGLIADLDLKIEAIGAVADANGIAAALILGIKELAALPSTGIDPRQHLSDLA